jgi:hypothetical protein
VERFYWPSHKRPLKSNNDIDDSLVNRFRALRDSRSAKRLQTAFEFTLYSCSEFEGAKEQYQTIRLKRLVGSLCVSGCHGVDLGAAELLGNGVKWRHGLCGGSMELDGGKTTPGASTAASCPD